jgi:hypothetical protein
MIYIYALCGSAPRSQPRIITKVQHIAQQFCTVKPMILHETKSVSPHAGLTGCISRNTATKNGHLTYLKREIEMLRFLYFRWVTYWMAMARSNVLRENAAFLASIA